LGIQETRVYRILLAYWLAQKDNMFDVGSFLKDALLRSGRLFLAGLHRLPELLQRRQNIRLWVLAVGLPLPGALKRRPNLTKKIQKIPA
jgi:hypothetical protein